ncbi:MAG: serine hydroxymethyltransferase [Hyphomicrobiales bacterium]|nr:MAG: serine hydroxymethyltransferase [Hyphomicrobiales bacterium]
MRRNDPTGAPGTVYFEFIKHGNTIKVVAIDAESGTEVSTLGPVYASENELQQIAYKKLQIVLQKNARPPKKRLF